MDLKKRAKFSKPLSIMLGIFFAIIVLSFYYSFYGKHKLLRVHFLDVGYGDAIFIELPDKTVMLIDSGEKEYAPGIVAYLKNQGVKEIDVAILTHPHDNHFGGFADIIDTFPIERFYFNGDVKNAQAGYSEMTEKLEQRGIPLTVVKRVERILPASKNTSVQILHPENLSGSANENSIVTWVTFGKTAFLFTSDIKKSQQKRIMALYPEIQSADCVQVPHHGGKISRKFAEFLGNKIFVISTGKNKYEKPDEGELEKLQGEILRTDRHGTIVLESDGNTVRLLREAVL